MKILIVNASDSGGGAAIAAYRLHKALNAQKIESEMLVQKKLLDDYNIIGPSSNREKFINILRPHIDQAIVKFYKNRDKILFSPAWLGFNDIVEKINEINPDIVHLHWICGGMMKVEDLKKIQAPIVWSLHDMWAFTGGCHYDEGCGAYEQKCGDCKVLKSNKTNDLSRKVFNRKEKTFTQINNMTIVGLSRWLSESAQKSKLLRDKKNVNLPNPIDTDIFKPFSEKNSRELWKLPKDKKLILFGALEATSDTRKGFDVLSQALSILKIEDVEFVVFGSSKPKKPPKFKFKTHYIGRLHDDISLVTLYSAVDVMIVPSLQENLSNAIMESLSCATPVVAFDVGGNSDMIEHKINGYLSKPFDPFDLANGIEWVLNTSNYSELCENARKKVVEEFDSVKVAKQYIELYKEILNAK